MCVSALVTAALRNDGVQWSETNHATDFRLNTRYTGELQNFNYLLAVLGHTEIVHSELVECVPVTVALFGNSTTVNVSRQQMFIVKSLLFTDKISWVVFY